MARLGRLDPEVGGPFDDQPADGVFGVAFHRGGRLQHFILVVSRRGDDVGDPQLRQRECPGLVEDHRPHPAQLLQHGASLDQHAAADHAADACRNGRRRGQHERAGAGYDQHRHRTDHVAREKEREHRGQDDGGNEPLGVAIGQALGGGLGRLGVLHQVDDLLQGRLLAEPLDRQLHRPVQVDRPGKDLVADGLVGRERLAGDRALIDGGTALNHAAVDRDAVAGPDDDDIVGVDLAHGNDVFVFVAGPSDAGLVGTQRQQRGDPAPRAVDGEVLQGFADQHDQDHLGGHGVLADVQGGKRGQADRQIRRDLPLRQGTDSLEVNGKSTHQRQKQRQVEAVYRG